MRNRKNVAEVMVVNELHPKVDLDKAVRHESIHVIILHKVHHDHD